MAAAWLTAARPAAKYGLLGLGWGGLLLLDPLNQILDRESPEAAASHWQRQQQQHDRRAGDAPLQPPAPLLSPARLATLRDEGWVVLENSLGHEALAAARSDCSALKLKGTLEATLQHSKSFRTDAVTWLAERHGADADDEGELQHPTSLGLRTALRRVRSVAVELCPPDVAGGSGDMVGIDGRQVKIQATLPQRLSSGTFLGVIACVLRFSLACLSLASLQGMTRPGLPIHRGMSRIATVTPEVARAAG